jgi:hypothetical protein
MSLCVLARACECVKKIRSTVDMYVMLLIKYAVFTSKNRQQLDDRRVPSEGWGSNLIHRFNVEAMQVTVRKKVRDERKGMWFKYLSSEAMRPVCTNPHISLLWWRQRHPPISWKSKPHWHAPSHFLVLYIINITITLILFILPDLIAPNELPKQAIIEFLITMQDNRVGPEAYACDRRSR